MIEKSKIIECVEKGNSNGLHLKIRDVCYCILIKEIDDYAIAYKSLFDPNAEQEIIDEYHNSQKVKFVKKFIYSLDGAVSSDSVMKEYEDITFGENKEAIITLLNRLPIDVEKGKISTKDAYNTEINLRKALVTTFSTKSRVDEQVIKVESKYNDICPYCNHEVLAKELTKEEAKRKYNLTENNYD